MLTSVRPCKKSSHALWLVSALAILLVAGTACRQQGQSQFPGAHAEPERVPDRSVVGVDFIVSEQGSPRLRIRAPHMAEYTGSDSAYTVLSQSENGPSERVLVFVFSEQGDSSATIQADRVHIGENEDVYRAEGNVIVLSQNGRRLESEHLVWDEPSARVHTPGFVRITTPDERIQGHELDADEDLSTYRLARVTGQVTVRD